jgi:hypothetical protein
MAWRLGVVLGSTRSRQRDRKMRGLRLSRRRFQQ